jgi:hypothetical protein
LHPTESQNLKKQAKWSAYLARILLADSGNTAIWEWEYCFVATGDVLDFHCKQKQAVLRVLIVNIAIINSKNCWD